jgi:hypothetical protein
MDGYEAVLAIPVDEAAYWLPIVRACHAYVVEQGSVERPAPNVQLVAKVVGRRLGGQVVRLKPLVGYGVLVNAAESTRGGHQAIYRVPDPDGVDRALSERGF